MADSGAALAGANNTLSESIGLWSAMNEVTQDWSKSSTALRTISARLRNTSGELEEMGEDTDGTFESITQLQQELYKLSGVDIFEIDGTTFKSTTDILRELATVWGDLTDIQTADITRIVAGTRQQSTLQALMSNFETVDKVIETANDSAGSAMEENEKRLDSITGRLTLFQAAYESLSMTMIDSDMFKNLIDGGTLGLEVLTGLIDQFGSLGNVIGVTSVLLSKDKLFDFSFSAKDGFNFGGVIPDVNKLKIAIESYNATLRSGTIDTKKYINAMDDEALRNAFNNLDGKEATFKNISTAMGTTTLKAKALNIGMKALSTTMNIAIGFGIGFAIDFIINKLTEMAERVDNAKEALADFNTEFENTQKQFNDTKQYISDISTDFDSLANGVDGSGKNISLTSDEFSRYNEIANEIADLFPEMVNGYTEQGNAILGTRASVEELTKALREQEEQQYRTVLAGASGVFGNIQTLEDEFRKITDIENQLNEATGIYSAFGSETASFTIGELLGIDFNDIETSKQLVEEILSLFDLARSSSGNVGTDQFAEGLKNIFPTLENYQLELLSTNLRNNATENQEILQELLYTIEIESSNLKNQYDSLNTIAKSFAGLNLSEIISFEDESFSDISNTLENFISNIDGEFLRGLGDTQSDITEWINENFLEPIRDPQIRQTFINSLNDIMYIDPTQFETADAFDAEIERLLNKIEELAGADLANAIEQSFNFEWFAIPDSAIASAEQLGRTFEEINTTMDNLQEKYQSLTSVMDEYNSTGIMSMDMLQTLTSLGNDYLQYLSFQDGQLRINEEGFIALAHAEIDAAEAAYLRESTNLLQTFQDETAATAYLASGLDTTATAALNAAEASWNLASAQYAVRVASGDITGDQEAAYQALIDSVNNTRQAFDLARNGIGTYTREVLGAGSASSDASSDIDELVDSLTDLKNAMDDAKSDIDSLLNTTMNMLKEEYTAQKDLLQDNIDLIEEQKDAINDRYDTELEALDATREAQQDAADAEIDDINARIDAQLELLRAEQSLNDYRDSLEDKTKAVSDIESELAELQYDDSAEAQKRRLELEEELASAKSDLDDLQYDRSIELQEEALESQRQKYEDENELEQQYLNEQYELRKEYLEKQRDDELASADARIDGYNDQIDELEKYLDSEAKLRAEAMALIEGQTDEFYQRLIEYNREYGTGIDADITIMWKEAYKALEEFGQNGMDVLATLEYLTLESYNLSLQIEEASEQAEQFTSGFAAGLANVSDAADNAGSALTSMIADVSYKIKDAITEVQSLAAQLFELNSVDLVKQLELEKVQFGINSLQGSGSVFEQSPQDITINIDPSNTSGGSINNVPDLTKEMEDFFANFPKFHTGGYVDENVPDKYKKLFALANGEVPAVIQNGETVMTARQMDNLSKSLNLNTNQQVSNTGGVTISFGDITFAEGTDKTTIEDFKQFCNKHIPDLVYRSLNKLHK